MMKWELNNIKTKRKGIELLNTFPNVFKCALFLLIGLLIILYFIPIKVLSAEDFRTHKYLKSWAVNEGDNFSVLYTHSVELCPVSETYKIKDRDIVLEETYFESFGAGLPSTTTHKFEITETGYRIYEINETMYDLVYRTGAERANHSLIYKDKSYRFLDFSKPRTGVELQIKKISLLKYIAKEVIK